MGPTRRPSHILVVSNMVIAGSGRGEDGDAAGERQQVLCRGVFCGWLLVNALGYNLAGILCMEEASWWF